MDCSVKMQGSSALGLRYYMEALEVEKLKIQVFQRELPLSLELVNQGSYPFRFLAFYSFFFSCLFLGIDF